MQPDERQEKGSTVLLFQLTTGAREIVTAVAVADGLVSADEQRLAIEIVGQFVPGYGESDLAADVARARARRDRHRRWSIGPGP